MQRRSHAALVGQAALPRRRCRSALAGCASLGSPPAAGQGRCRSTRTSQSNLTSLSEVIEKHPDDPQAYNMRGSVFGEAGQNDQALADFNKAISLDPKYAQAYANRALVYRKTGKLDLALADYNKALAIDAELRAGLSRPRHRPSPSKARPRRRSPISTRRSRCGRTMREAYYNRGLLYQSQHQHAFAIDDFSTALGLTTQKAEPFVARALSYLAVGDNKSAAGDLDEAVQLDPQNLQAWTSRGLAYERLGDKDKAAGSYAKALNIDSKYETGLSRLRPRRRRGRADLSDVLILLGCARLGMSPQPDYAPTQAERS